MLTILAVDIRCIVYSIQDKKKSGQICETTVAFLTPLSSTTHQRRQRLHLTVSEVLSTRMHANNARHATAKEDPHAAPATVRHSLLLLAYSRPVSPPDRARLDPIIPCLPLAAILDSIRASTHLVRLSIDQGPDIVSAIFAPESLEGDMSQKRNEVRGAPLSG